MHTIFITVILIFPELSILMVHQRQALPVVKVTIVQKQYLITQSRSLASQVLSPLIQPPGHRLALSALIAQLVNSALLPQRQQIRGIVMQGISASPELSTHLRMHALEAHTQQVARMLKVLISACHALQATIALKGQDLRLHAPRMLTVLLQAIYSQTAL